MTVSDELGADYLRRLGARLGDAWAGDAAPHAGMRWRGGFLSLPDRDGALGALGDGGGGAGELFLLHPSGALDATQVERLVACGLVADTGRVHVARGLHGAQGALELRAFRCLF